MTTCEKCGHEYGSGQSGPVTGNGWYGNDYVIWGKYAGVHAPIVVRTRCPHCGHEQPTGERPDA